MKIEKGFSSSGISRVFHNTEVCPDLITVETICPTHYLVFYKEQYAETDQSTNRLT